MIKPDGFNSFVYSIVFCCLLLTAQAQDSDLRPVSSTYALKNATIVQAPGRTIERGTVVIENGLIKAVGASVAIPPEAIILPADSMYIYAGFISGLSNIGVEKPKEKDTKDDKKKTGTPTYERAGITPNVSVRDLLSAKEKSIADFRKLGFTAAHTVPHTGMIAGTGALILLSNSETSMLVKENTSMFSQLQGANGVYPNTVIGVMAKYRDMYRKATQARSYEGSYQANSAGMERPVSDEMLEAMYPVIGGQLPVAFKSEDLLDIHRVITLKNDLGFALMLGEVKQGWDAIDAIKQTNAPVFLSLDLPEMKEEEKKEESEEKEEGEEAEEQEEEAKEEPSAEDKEREALEARKNEMIKKYYTQPSLFSSQGIRYGFSTLEGKSKDFKANVRKIIANGLSQDQALAALTTSPATLLGVSSTMGTVDAGKMANLIVTDKPYFEEKSNVRYVFVDGMKYEYEVKEPKKKKGTGEDIDPTGKWNYSYNGDGQSWNGNFTIEGSKDSYTGTMYLSFNDTNNDIVNLEVDGNLLTFEIEVDAGEQTVTVSISVEVDGNSFEGTLTAGPYGSYDMEGDRDPKS